ncbi:MAG: YvcK family protein [Firmicutes bacterium]|nr:YvcK family protein [Bacillota bacterium]
MKKVVVLGGGTGMSNLLRGLKQYPLDITAIVTVCDDGKSTGILREEFNIPAVGDIRRVLVSLSETEPLVMDLFNYRFNTSSDLDGHTVGNLLLTAASEIRGNLSDGIEALSKVLNLKGKVIPLTEDNVTLMAEMEDGTIVEGEHHITSKKSKIKKVYYKEEAIATKEALNAIKNSDLIVFSMGSLFTSIIPNLLIDSIVKQIEQSKAKLMYVCNMMTQPGETDDFKVTDHIKKLNEYLGNRNIDIVLANTGIIDAEMAKFYETQEQKDPVVYDEENFDKYNIEVISDDFTFITDNNLLRHDNIKLGFHIFYYLMKK